LRGNDVAYNPVFIAYALVSSTGTVELFVDESKLDSSARTSLLSQESNNDASASSVKVTIKPYESFLQRIEQLSSETIVTKDELQGSGERKARILVDQDACNWAVYEKLVAADNAENVVHGESPIKLMKSLKNSVELQGMRNAHVRDAVALVKFFTWLEKMLENEPESAELTECGVARKLEKLRREQEQFVSLSFATIAGSGANGAIIHYNADNDEAGCARIKKDTMFLLDSGAQYLDGTTDVTRTVLFGNSTAHQRECFTRVLKGHIAIDSLVFPSGITGYKIDALARCALWQVGLDYNHGTGHGVGHFLNVHEGPQGIGVRKHNDDCALMENMTITNEPGYYEVGQFGIRIENVLIVRAKQTPFQFNMKQYLGFEHITLVPMQTSLIEKKLLTEAEVQWVNNYNQKCLETLAPRLADDKESLAFLQAICKAI